MASPAGLRSNRESRRPAVGAPQHDHCHNGYNEQHDSQQFKQDVVACGPEVDAADTEEAAYDSNHPPGETAHSPLSSNPSRDCPNSVTPGLEKSTIRAVCAKRTLFVENSALFTPSARYRAAPSHSVRCPRAANTGARIGSACSGPEARMSRPPLRAGPRLPETGASTNAMSGRSRAT